MRCFVAVWPPEAVLASLERLPRPSLEAGRWTSRDTWHVTLRFLGEVEEPDLDRLVDALRPAVTACSAPRVDLGPATVLLNPGTLVAPVGGLVPLATAVVAATAGIGRPPERRPFAGHLTLARARGRGRLPRRLAGQQVSGTWPVGHVSVVRSRLHPTGARYEELAAVPVGQPPPDR